MKGNEFWLAVVKISQNWKSYYYYTVSFINSTIEQVSQNKGQHSDSHSCDNLQYITEWGWVGCEELCRLRRMLSTEAEGQGE